MEHMFIVSCFSSAMPTARDGYSSLDVSVESVVAAVPDVYGDGASVLGREAGKACATEAMRITIINNNVDSRLPTPTLQPPVQPLFVERCIGASCPCIPRGFIYSKCFSFLSPLTK